MENLTRVVAPWLLTKPDQLGLVVRTPKTAGRLFQTLAEPKSGFAPVAADSGPLIGGGPPIPNELGTLKVTLINDCALSDEVLASIRRVSKATAKSKYFG